MKPYEFFINKTILIGITYFTSQNEIIKERTFFGVIEDINEDSIIIKINKTGEKFSLPPDLDAIQQAPKGIYYIHEAKEKIVDPDYISKWNIINN